MPTPWQWLLLGCIGSQIPLDRKGWLRGITDFLSLCPGQASSANAEQSGKLAEFTSNLAWDFATKEGFRVFKEMPAAKPLIRSCHTWARPWSLLSPTGRRSYSSVPGAPLAHTSKGVLVFSVEGLSPWVQELHDRLQRFMRQHVYPLEPELQRHQASVDRWTPSLLIEDLKVRQPVRESGCPC